MATAWQLHGGSPAEVAHSSARILIFSPRLSNTNYKSKVLIYRHTRYLRRSFSDIVVMVLLISSGGLGRNNNLVFVVGFFFRSVQNPDL
jgi:hypothetical protein